MRYETRDETARSQAFAMVPLWQARLRGLAPIPLRLLLGFGFLYHGYPKLFTADGNQGAAAMLAGMGFPAPGLTAYLLGGFEFFGGILLMLGVAVRAVALLGILEMLVAAFLVHWPAGFNFMNVIAVTDAGMQFGLPGYEVNLLYIAGFMSLLLSGAGALSVPSVRRDRVEAAPEEAPREEAAGAPRW